MNSFLQRTIRIVWYLTAAIVIFMAVMVTVARGLTPLINRHKVRFENWASEVMGAPVRVERLAAYWDGFRPDIKLLNVRILSPKADKTRLHVDELRIDLNIWQSLIHRRIQPDEIEITGAHLIVYQSADHKLQIAGLKSDQIDLSTKQQGNNFNNQEIMDWIASQRYLLLKDLHVVYYGTNDQRYYLHFPELFLLNGDTQHFLSGSVNLARPGDQQASQLSFASIINGDLSSIDSNAIQLYFNIKQLQLQDLFVQPKVAGYRLSSGFLTGQIWVKIKALQFQSIQSLFQLSSAELVGESAEKSLNIDNASGNVLWQQQQNGWELSGDQVNLTTPDKAWPTSQFDLTMHTTDQGDATRFWISYLNLADVKRFLLGGYFSIPESIRHLVDALNPRGELFDFSIDHQSNQNQAATFDVSGTGRNLGVDRYQSYPGVEGISGAFHITQDAGIFDLSSQNVSLNFGKLFLNPLVATRLQAMLQWYYDADDGWIVKLDNLSALTDDLALVGSGSLVIPKEASQARVSLLAGYDLKRSDRITQYLPMGIFDNENVVYWLNHAFVSGDGAAGHILLRGPLKDFPFDRHEGVFLIDGKVRSTEFHFADGWPDANKLSADLLFSGRTMTAHATAGEVENSQISSFDAIIPTMGGPKPDELFLKGGAGGRIKNLVSFLLNSPLKEQLAPVFQELNLSGNSQVSLKIHLPLSNVDQTTVHGNIQFDDAAVTLPDFLLNGTHLTGHLIFDNQRLSSNNLSLQLFDYPVALQFKTVPLSNKAIATQLAFSSAVDVKKLISNYHLNGLDDLTGKINYQGFLNFPDDSGFPIQLHLFSTLEGLSINMPLPLKKEADTVIPTSVDYNYFKKQPSSLAMTVKNQLVSYLLFDHQQKNLQLKEGEVDFGLNGHSIQLPANQTGLTLRAHLPSLDIQSWQNYLQSKKSQLDDDTQKNMISYLKEKIHQCEITIDNFTLYNQSMNPVTFVFEPKTDGVSLLIKSLRIAGSLFVPYDLKQQTLKGQFSKIYLQDLNDTDRSTILPAQLPRLSLSADNFQYGDHYFGNVALSAYPSQTTWIIQSLSIASPLLTGDLSGYWGNTLSSLKGRLQSDDVTTLMQSFNIKNSLNVKEGSATFDFSWPSPIFNFSLRKAKGSLSIKLGSGRIIDLGDEATKELNLGRLVTLLSVNRLIHLDFSDFTEKGFSFDSMMGDFSFNKGSLFTKDLALSGSVADIALRGQVDLISKKIDLLMAVMPHMTASLPIIAAVVINPVAGAVAWAADKVFSKTIGKKMIVNRYRLTGDWSKPVITKM